jgi:hypothetical protein
MRASERRSCATRWAYCCRSGRHDRIDRAFIAAPPSLHAARVPWGHKCLSAVVIMVRRCPEKRRLLVLAAVSLALSLSGCARGASTAVRESPHAQGAASPAATATAAPQQASPSDGPAILRLKGYKSVASTERSRLSAADAAARVHRAGADGKTTVLSVSKVRLTGPGVRNKLVWVIVVADVELSSHGILTSSSPSSMQPHSGRGAVCIDANTGEEGPDVFPPIR